MINSEKIKCSVGILTLNSARTLRRSLESVKDFDEIIICDGNSTDNTIQIAKEFGAKIIRQYETNEPNKKIDDFSRVRNKCLDAATNNWFLYIDSDEAISNELRDEIRYITEQKRRDLLVYQVPNKIIYNGEVIEHASSYPGFQTRFFNKKSGGRFVKPVHERLKFEGEVKVGNLKGPWYVFLDDEDYHKFWEDMRFYVKKEVKRSRDLKLGQFILWNLIVRPLKLVKLIFRILYMYLRYGRKRTIPIKFEFQRVVYATYLILMQTKLRLIK